MRLLGRRISPCSCIQECVTHKGWLRVVGSLKIYVSFAKEPYKRDDILQKRPMILKSLLIVATPYVYAAARQGCDTLALTPYTPKIT